MAQHHIAEDAREAVEEQIEQLRNQLHAVTQSLHDHGIGIEEFREEARELAEGAAKNAQRAADFAQGEVKAVARAARRNPAGASTALTLAVAIGFGIGYAVCQLQHENAHNRHWWEP